MIVKVRQDASIAATHRAEGSWPSRMPEQLATPTRLDMARWAKVVQAAKIEVD